MRDRIPGDFHHPVAEHRRVDGQGEIEPVGIELGQQLGQQRLHAIGLRLAGFWRESQQIERSRGVEPSDGASAALDFSTANSSTPSSTGAGTEKPTGSGRA